MKTRLFLSLLLVLVPLTAVAQSSSEFAVFASFGTYNDTDLFDPAIPELDATLELDGASGFGISYYRFFGPSFSTEFAAQRLSADADLVVGGFGTPRNTVGFGELNQTIVSGTALWHFARGRRVSPHVGGGIAYVSGDIEIEDGAEPTEDVDLDNEITWTAVAGIDIGISERTGDRHRREIRAISPRGGRGGAEPRSADPVGGREVPVLSYGVVTSRSRSRPSLRS